MVGRCKVMVVEGAGMLRRIGVGILDEREQLEVVEQVTSGPSVVAVARRMAPQVIVLDHELPDGAGLSVLPALRSEFPGTRIVMWTSSADVAKVAVEMGADGSVGKERPLGVLLPDLLAELPAPSRAGRYLSG